MLATPAAMHGGLEEQCRRFDRQLSRLKRLRNSAIHGGPVSETACQSVEFFASTLGHLCLNEAIRAVLTGSEISTHIKEYRDDHVERFKRIRETGDVDALFVPSELDLDADEASAP
jgi:translation initiation factor 2 beta subunit (eIF-2beta)/eIF-5